MAYQQVVLAKRPGAGSIVPGETFRLETKQRVTEAELKDGQFEAKTLYLSLDPAMRGWLNGLSLSFHFAIMVCPHNVLD